MTPLGIFVLSLSMSADACAAAIGRGAVHRPTPVQALKGGLVFGLIEALTPIAGWAVGLTAAAFVERIDHWIAFGLLALIGARMAWEGFHRDDAEPEVPAHGRKGVIALVLMATGTSIDAAAVGVTLAFLKENILLIAACIGLTTFSLTTAGMLMGRALGSRFGAVVEVIGGLLLIGIGIKILLDHTQLIL